MITRIWKRIKKAYKKFWKDYDKYNKDAPFRDMNGNIMYVPREWRKK
jgi:hypothetical protein